jgi:hypothetical protein
VAGSLYKQLFKNSSDHFWSKQTFNTMFDQQQFQNHSLIKHIQSNFWSNNHLKQLLIKEQFQVIFDQTIFDQNTSNICKCFFIQKKLNPYLINNIHNRPWSTNGLKPYLTNNIIITCLIDQTDKTMFEQQHLKPCLIKQIFTVMFDQKHI